MKSLTVFRISYKCVVFGAIMTMICLIRAVVFLNLFKYGYNIDTKLIILPLLILTFIGLSITALSLIVFLISGYQHTKGMDDRDR